MIAKAKVKLRTFADAPDQVLARWPVAVLCGKNQTAGKEMRSWQCRQVLRPGPALQDWAVRCREEGLALAVVPVPLCKTPPKAATGWEALGLTGSLWRQESACDLESERPAKGITMRNVTRHRSL